MPRKRKEDVKIVPYRGLKPKSVSDEAWTIIVEAWENGLSDREASFRASKEGNVRIKESDIKKWMKDNPDIADLKEHLQVQLIGNAKLLISESIRNGDVKTAKWYLERKASNEFSTKSAVAFEGAVVELTLEEKEKALKEMWEKFDK